MKANEIGLRLELTGGMPSWQTQPVLLHQETIDIIRASIRPNTQNPDCAYVHHADVYIEFPDGSLKRPDIIPNWFIIAAYLPNGKHFAHHQFGTVSHTHSVPFK